MTLAEFFKDLLNKGISISKVARDLDLSYTTLNEYKKGKVKRPDPETMKLIAEKYGYELGYFNDEPNFYWNDFGKIEIHVDKNGVLLNADERKKDNFLKKHNIETEEDLINLLEEHERILSKIDYYEKQNEAMKEILQVYSPAKKKDSRDDVFDSNNHKNTK